MTIFVPANVHQAYILALGGFGANGLGSNGLMNNGTMWYNGQPLTFAGYKIELVNGLPNDVMIAAQKSNLQFMCGLLSDHSEIKLIDTSATLGDDNVRIIMKLTGCVNYSISQDVVTYGIVNAAN